MAPLFGYWMPYPIGRVYLVLLALCWAWIFSQSLIAIRKWQVKLTPKGYGARAGGGEVELLRWKGDEAIDLRRLGRGRYRLLIWDDLGLSVRIVVRVSDEEAESLRGELSRLIGRRVGLEK